MKIAFVANTCWNIYNFRRGLVHHFLDKGDEVLVLAPKDDYTENIRGWGVRYIDTPLEGTGSNPLKDLKYLNRLHSTFKAEKPDAVLTYTIKSNIYSSLAGKLTSTPVLCNVSGLGTVFLVKGMTGKMAISLYKLAFRYSSHVFFQNEDDRKLFASRIKIKQEKTSILPGSGIDLNKFKTAKLPGGDVTSFVMIARVIVEKGVREYAEAASFFKDDNKVSFTLIGKFDEDHARSVTKSELNSWIESNSLKYYSHSDEIMKVIEAHDAVVLPSYREGTSRTLLEGAAMGRPLLASDVPGCRDVVVDGYNGFLFEVRNSRNLIDKLKLFLSLTKEERQQLAANSRTLVEKTYDERIVIDMYEETIRRIIT